MSRVESIVKYIESGATSLQRVGLELEHFIYNDAYEVISYPQMQSVLEEICEKRGFLMSGKRYDYSRGARTFLDEFRGGKIGRISLEWPE